MGLSSTRLLQRGVQTVAAALVVMGAPHQRVDFPPSVDIPLMVYCAYKGTEDWRTAFSHTRLRWTRRSFRWAYSSKSTTHVDRHLRSSQDKMTAMMLDVLVYDDNVEAERK